MVRINTYVTALADPYNETWFDLYIHQTGKDNLLVYSETENVDKGIFTYSQVENSNPDLCWDLLIEYKNTRFGELYLTGNNYITTNTKSHIAYANLTYVSTVPNGTYLFFESYIASLDIVRTYYQIDANLYNATIELMNGGDYNTLALKYGFITPVTYGTNKDWSTYLTELGSGASSAPQLNKDFLSQSVSTGVDLSTLTYNKPK